MTRKPLLTLFTFSLLFFTNANAQTFFGASAPSGSATPAAGSTLSVDNFVNRVKQISTQSDSSVNQQFTSTFQKNPPPADATTTPTPPQQAGMPTIQPEAMQPTAPASATITNPAPATTTTTTTTPTYSSAPVNPPAGSYTNQPTTPPPQQTQTYTGFGGGNKNTTPAKSSGSGSGSTGLGIKY